MSANNALNANANASAEPHSPTAAASDERQPTRPARRLNLKQESLVREFQHCYDINPGQISFDGESGAPFFHFEALAQIVTALTCFAELSVQQVEINHTHGHATSEASIRLQDGRIVSSFGSAFINESLPEDQVIDNFQTALDVSRARALRSALRMVGFDPLRAHEAAKQHAGPSVPQITSEEAQRNKELAEIHLLADEAGLRAPDDTKYRSLISTFFGGLDSARDMDARQRAQFIAMLRSFRSAHARLEVEAVK